MLTDDLIELRVKGAKPRMEALNQVVKDRGVTHMAAICAICKTQFSKVMPYYGFQMDQIVSVHQLVNNAIYFGDSSPSFISDKYPSETNSLTNEANDG